MINKILDMYITMTPLIFTGILNMVFCSTHLCEKLRKPLDGGRCFKDGKRIFGDNKTIKGLVGYIVIGILTSVVWGVVCSVIPTLYERNLMYVNYNNTVLYNVIIGALLGLAYAIFELPNSFLKRRFDVMPGKTTTGFKKYIFILYDQCDSVIGCGLVVVLVYPISVATYFMYVGVGIITHLVLNAILYVLKFRKNIL